MPRALIIHAHPDDEAFANSGRVLDLVEHGYDVVAAIATAGEASEPSAPDTSSARARRLEKYEASLRILGVRDWSWLDDTIPWVDEPAGPLVADAAPAALSEAVQRTVRSCSPDLVLSVGLDGLTGHPDHVAVARAITHAASTIRVRSGYWGASLRTTDVVAGRQLAAPLADGRPLGSGRVTGSNEPMTLHQVGAHADKRRAVLDVYRPGLGTAPLDELMAGAERLGDSILLRAIFEATGWASEHYTRLDEPPR